MLDQLRRNIHATEQNAFAFFLSQAKYFGLWIRTNDLRVWSFDFFQAPRENNYFFDRVECLGEVVLSLGISRMVLGYFGPIRHHQFIGFATIGEQADPSHRACVIWIKFIIRNTLGVVAATV